MVIAGAVLTGGASRRMGRDKAALPHPVTGEPLARHLARLVGGVADPVVELGPGLSGLEHLADTGGGPLAALAGAGTWWAALPPGSAVLVVATDLPRLTAGLLRWLAGHPSPGAVIPADGGTPQYLCARYPAAALSGAAAHLERGGRSMAGWVATLDAHIAGPPEWTGAAGDPLALRDADTPEELAALW